MPLPAPKATQMPKATAEPKKVKEDSSQLTMEQLKEKMMLNGQKSLQDEHKKQKMRANPPAGEFIPSGGNIPHFYGGNDDDNNYEDYGHEDYYGQESQHQPMFNPMMMQGGNLPQNGVDHNMLINMIQ